MQDSIKSYDAHTWTGEDDFVEIEILPVVMISGGLAMLIIGFFV
jgi:hypothetical protein